MRALVCHGIIFSTILVISAASWFPRSPNRFEKHRVPFHRPLHEHERFHMELGRKGKRLYEMLSKRRREFYVPPIERVRLQKFEEYDLPSDDVLSTVPIIIQQVPMKELEKSAPTNFEILDKTSIRDEIIHLLQRILKESHHNIKKKRPVLSKAHHIIISQPAAETTANVKATSNTCPTQNGGTGSPRSEIPQPSPQPPPPAPPPPPPPPQPPANPTPPIAPTIPQAPLPAPSPRAEIPMNTPTAYNPMGGITATQSQIMASLGGGHLIPEQFHLAQQPAITLAPVVAELSALLGGHHGLAMGDAGYAMRAVNPVTVAQPAFGMLQMNPVNPQAEAHSSVTAELINLLSTLQQQRELQRQQLEQQQSLQQEQQNLLQQQRSQLAQQLQQLQQQQQPQPIISAPIQPIVSPPTQTDLQQSRSGMPISSEPNNIIMDESQQALLPEKSNVISVIPRTILTFSTPEDRGLENEYLMPFSSHSSHAVRQKKKYMTRRMFRRTKDSLMY